MRIDAIAGAAIYLATIAGCSAELAQRPTAHDPTSAAAAEAPFKPPPGYEEDPLLQPVPPKGAEPSEHQGPHHHGSMPMPDGGRP